MQSLRTGSDGILLVVADRQSAGDGYTEDLQLQHSGSIRQRGRRRHSTTGSPAARKYYFGALDAVQVEVVNAGPHLDIVYLHHSAVGYVMFCLITGIRSIEFQ